MSKYLIGKTIEKIRIASDKKAILFVTNDENVVANADGDCCSETWIEHVSLPAMGFPCKVVSMGSVEMPNLGSPNKYRVISYYGYKITTDKGDILIDYRNKSNGYYGGNLCFPDDYFYGGVYGQNISNEEWKDIEKDI